MTSGLTSAVETKIRLTWNSRNVDLDRMTKEEKLRADKARWAREWYWKNRDKLLKKNKTAATRAYKARWSRENRSDAVRAYDRIRLKKRRAEWFAANGPCVKCGGSKRLELDHIDPKSKVNHSVWSWKKQRRDAELSKCQVLCFLCHRLKTNEDRGWKTHGEVRYQMGCRCSECRRVHAKKIQKDLRSKDPA
jgi:hypothetical protein